MHALPFVGHARRGLLIAVLGTLGAFSTLGCKGAADRLLSRSGCKTGETANEDPPLCYRVPAGLTQKGEPIRRPGHFQIGYQGDAGTVAFLVRDLGTLESTWKALQTNAARSKSTDAKEEVLDDGKTRVLTYTTPGSGARSIISVLRTGPTHLLECEAEVPRGKPTDDLLAACKELHEP